jgi:hypothetical protein
MGGQPHESTSQISNIRIPELKMQSKLFDKIKKSATKASLPEEDAPEKKIKAAVEFTPLVKGERPKEKEAVIFHELKEETFS